MKKIKEFVKYHVEVSETIYSNNQLKIKKFFNRDEYLRFNLLRYHVNVMTNHLEILLKFINNYSKNMSQLKYGHYDKLMNLYMEEYVDVDSRTIEEYTAYNILNLDNYNQNLNEQFRIMHVLKSLLNGTPLYKIDKNFKTAMSTRIKNKTLISIVYDYIDFELKCNKF